MRCSPSWRSGGGSRFLPAWVRLLRVPKISFRRWGVSFRRLFLIVVAILAGAAAYRVSSIRAAEEWLPISPEELKMTSVPQAPGAPAINLYREVDRDDSNFHTPHEYNYVRIKVLTE